MPIMILLISSCEKEVQQSASQTSGDFAQEVYVWQRVWTDEVQQALQSKATQFDKATLLAAEISYDPEGGNWNCQYFSAPLQWAKDNSSVYGLAFRIHADAAQSAWSEQDTQKIIEYIEPYAVSAKAIQIDYDCPSKKLADYAKLLQQIKKSLPEVSLELTCLPDWLDYPAFSALVQNCDRYIMQVHGVSGHGTL